MIEPPVQSPEDERVIAAQSATVATDPIIVDVPEQMQVYKLLHRSRAPCAQRLQALPDRLERLAYPLVNSVGVEMDASLTSDAECVRLVIV